MTKKRDDWHKPRNHGQHLTYEEMEIVRAHERRGTPAGEVARELRCSSRTIYMAYLRINPRRRRQGPGRPAVTPKPAPQRKPVDRAARFYHSNFEPT